MVKSFFLGVIFFFVIKGVTYIIAADFVKMYSQKLAETPNIQLVLFGWILVICSFIAYISYVRYLTY